MAEVLAVFKYASPAQTLVAALKGQGLQSHYRFEHATSGHVVCLEDDTQLSQAQAITNRFTQNPNAPEFTQFAWESGGGVPMASQWSLAELIPRLAKLPLVTLIAVVCIVLYVAVYGLGWVSAYEALFFQPFGSLSDTQQWWRPITPAFIHFSVEHLVFNLIWWGWLGSQIETRLSSSWLLVLLLVLALSSNTAQYFVSGWQFGGMSGVVYGLTGYVWWMQWLQPSHGLSIPKALVGLSLVWMVLGFADLLWIDMANTAHLAGLVAGCGVAFCHARLFSYK